MSIIDSRVLQYLGGTRTEKGIALLTTKLGSVNQMQLNSLLILSNIQYKISEAKKDNIGVELYVYEGDLSQIHHLINTIAPETGMPVIEPTKIVRLRDISDLLPIVRTAMLYNYNLNALQLAPNFYYDAPYFKIGDKLVCYFKPQFEKQIDFNKCRIQNNIFIYEYMTDVFYLEQGYNRHIKSTRLDRLSINLSTGKSVVDYSDVVGNKMVNYKFIFNTDDGRWHKDTRYSKVVKVEGYKQC